MPRTRYTVRLDELTEVGYLSIEFHTTDETELLARLTTKLDRKKDGTPRQDNFFDTGNPKDVANMVAIYPQWVLDNINNLRKVLENA